MNVAESCDFEGGGSRRWNLQSKHEFETKAQILRTIEAPFAQDRDVEYRGCSLKFPIYGLKFKIFMSITMARCIKAATEIHGFSV